MPDLFTHPAPVLASWWRWVIITLLVLEVLTFTQWRGDIGPYWSPVLLLLLALGMSLLLLGYGRGRQLAPAAAPAWPRWLIIVPVGVAGGWFLTNAVKRVLRTFWRLDEWSDILPSLQVYAKRWVLGQEIYKPLTWEIGYFLLPTYLPAMWFPAALGEWLGIDYRLMAFGILLLGVMAYLVVLGQLGRGWLSTLLLALAPFALFYKLMNVDFGYIGITVEYMILGYYSILLAGILLANWPLQALGLLLCLLSRYSLVFWAPFYLALLFFEPARRQALWIAGSVAVGILFFYIVPYLSHNWLMFSSVQEYYTRAAASEWDNYGAPGRSGHLYNGVGMAPFFLEHLSGTSIDKILVLKKVHLALIVTVVALAGLVYWRWPRLRSDYRVYAIVTLKIYLAFFYSFVQVPYYYLATLSCFVSVFLLLIVVLLRPGAPQQTQPAVGSHTNA